MVTWIAANAATIMISLILLVLTGLAIRSVYKNRGAAAEDNAVAAMAALQAISRAHNGEVDKMNQADILEEKRAYVIRELKKNGCRITNQRQILIDVILQDECCCCKEMYYQALEKDPTIGMATVYRMVKTLEEIGLIQRKNLYRIDGDSASA